MRNKTDILLTIFLFATILVLATLNLSFGDANISGVEIIRILSGEPAEYNTWSFIVENRLNRTLVAIFGGGALAVSGLILQVYFRNPLAGPGVLGITSGASLGVAIVVLGGLGLTGTIGAAGAVIFGSLGAFAVLLLLLFISRFVRNYVTLLVIGLMIGYFAAAFVNMLYLWSDEEQTREFVIWGLGSFEGLLTSQVYAFIGIISLFTAVSFSMVKGLNGIVLGEDYARSLGINLKVQKTYMILVTSVLAAVVTAYCGPISFIGIAVPQLIRVAARSRNHAMLIPLCFLGGGFLGVSSDLIVRLAGSSLPLNTVTALIGAPVIIWTIIKLNKRIAQV